MELIITTAITAAVSALIGGAVASLMNRAGKAASQSVDEARGIQEGMRALLWRELRNIHSNAVQQGGMDLEERRHLENVYSAYHNIGGNGTGTRLYEESMQLPVMD